MEQSELQNTITSETRSSKLKIPRWIWVAIWLALIIWAFARVQDMVGTATGNNPVAVPYSFFRDEVANGNVESVVFQNDQIVGLFANPIRYPMEGSPELRQGTLQGTYNYFVTILPPIPDNGLMELLVSKGVSVTSKSTTVSPIIYVLVNFGPLVLIVIIIVWLMRRKNQSINY
ncbi:MAG: hypothetical protein GC179_24225 [Anaerolineaceae bacterium]|nr:hypothetical protein [Anaerolineaceae bacterium]